MEKQKNHWIQELIIWAIILVLTIGAVTLGNIFRTQIHAQMLYFFISLSALSILYWGSIIANIFFKKWMKDKNAQEISDYLESRMKHMQLNAYRAKQHLKWTYIGIMIYLILSILSILAICFFSFAFEIHIQISVVVAISFLLYGYISRFFSKNEKPDITYALSEKDYDILYHIVREEANLSNDAPLYIFLGSPDTEQECNASVMESGNTVYLLLGPMLLCVADENELRQVIRHEFAHIHLNHTKETLKYGRILSYLTNADISNRIFDVLASFSFAFPASYLSFQVDLYVTFLSSKKEVDADSYASDERTNVYLASVLAKLAAHKLFVYEQDPYMNRDFYRDETIPEHLVTNRIHMFREALTTRQQEWRTMIENQIPSKVASHPTFRQRWDALGNCEYSLEPAPQKGEFAQQCWAVAAEADRRATKIEPETYKELRKYHYLDHLESVTEFEKHNLLGTPEEMRPVITGYYRIGMPEKAEALCDRLIAENDSVFATAFVRFWKGILLLHRYDQTGLDYIYQAMNTNRNYIDEGLSEIGSFCTMMGLEEELEHYRSISASYVQQEMDHCAKGITQKAKLTSDQLPNGWQEEIISYILKHGEEKISHIYLVREIVNDDYAPSSFVLRYKPDTSEDDKERIYDLVFRLLDDWPIDWEFCLYDYENSMDKVLQKIPGACIYGQN